MLGFRDFPVPNKFMDKRSGGSIMIFSRNFFVSQCRKFSYRKHSALCFEKFPVAKAFMDQKVGRVSIFSVENF